MSDSNSKGETVDQAMKYIKLIFLLSMISLFSSCSVKKPDAAVEVNPPNSNPNTASTVGPFKVEFADAINYQHNFKVNITGADGKVEYQIELTKDNVIGVEVVKSSVVGCDATRVVHEVFWIPDARRPQEGKFVTNGSFFQVYANIQGVLRHTFRGLAGCTAIDLTTVLKKY